MKVEHKRNIARCFNRAVSTYDAVADLQLEVGNSLLARLKPYSESVNQFIDVGAGTGMLIHQIEKQFKHANCYYLDIAHKMLSQCQLRANEHRSAFVCADFDEIPFVDSSFDFVFSSMCLQWSLDLAKTLTELVRVCAPGGVLGFCFLTEGTLSELAHSFNGLARESVNGFYSIPTINSIIRSLPATVHQLQTELHVKCYKQVTELFYFLKKTGANYCTERNTPYLSHSQFRWLEQYYRDHFEQNGLVQASFNVTYLIMRKC